MGRASRGKMQVSRNLIKRWRKGSLEKSSCGPENRGLGGVFWAEESVCVKSHVRETTQMGWKQQADIHRSCCSATKSCPTFCKPVDWLQHTRLPCPSLSPRVCPNSCPLSRRCYLNISSSSPSPAFNLSQHQGLFKWVSSSHQVAKLLEFQLQHQSFQWTPRTDLLQDGLVGSPCSPRDSQESSPTPQFKSINSLALSFVYSPTLTAIHDYWKNHSSD